MAGIDPFEFVNGLAPSDTHTCVPEGDQSEKTNDVSASITDDHTKKNDAERALRHYLISLLSRREYSVFELTQKSETKGYCRSLIDASILSLQQKGYQSDSRFCEHFVRYQASKGKGPRFIAQALRQKGLAPVLINEYVYQQDSLDWFAIAQDSYARKFKTPVTDHKDRAKRQRYLISRGFDSEIVNNLISR